MDSKYDPKTAGIQATESHIGDGDRKDGDVNPMGLNTERGPTSTGNVDNEVLEHAIVNLENKKTTWYAYFTTVDFWIVLALG
jgi:solute carrier family 35 protein F1/2